VPGTRVAGKTGTSDAKEVFANFVGLLPAERPRYVVVVSVLTADQDATGATVAAPLFSRVAAELLASPP
jgi:cell division protein FtsI (penicillin-binding protein 3)